MTTWVLVEVVVRRAQTGEQVEDAEGVGLVCSAAQQNSDKRDPTAAFGFT